MQRNHRIILIFCVVAVIIALAGIAQGGQASGRMQTVPPEEATQTAAPGEPTATPTIEPSGTPVATSTPTPTPTPTMPFPWDQPVITLIFFLVCGLGGVAGIVILVLYLLRRSSRPPAAGGAGQ